MRNIRLFKEQVWKRTPSTATKLEIIMSYKLFIDDEREPIGDDWIVVRSSLQAVQIVLARGLPAFISFDHDLGGEDTSMAFLHWMGNICLDAGWNFDFEYTVHSQNPIGRDNIIGFIESFKRNQI